MRGVCPLVVAAVLLVAGCQDAVTDRDKQERVARWNQTRAGVRLKLAEEHLVNGRLKEAALELASARKMSPENPRAALLSAKLALAEGELERAEQWLAQAAPDARGEAEFHLLRGVVHEAAGQSEQAVSDYAAAMELDSTDAELPLAYAGALLGAGRPEDARDFLERRRPQLAGGCEYHQLAGDVFLALGDGQRAADNYEIAARFGPLPQHTRQMQAFLLLELGRDRQAVQAFESLVGESPEPAPLLVIGLSRALINSGRAGEARRRLAVLMRTEQDNAEVWKLLAQATARGGDLARAVETARRAVELAPDDASARQLVAALAARDGQWALASRAAHAAAELAPQDELNAELLRWVERAQGADAGQAPAAREELPLVESAAGTEAAQP